MNKKKFYLICFAVLLMIGLIIYFRPLSLSNTTNAVTQVHMTLNEYGIRNGESYIDSFNYKTTTEEKIMK